jgi:hypothetical protein
MSAKSKTNVSDSQATELLTEEEEYLVYKIVVHGDFIINVNDGGTLNMLIGRPKDPIPPGP